MSYMKKKMKEKNDNINVNVINMKIIDQIKTQT